MAEIRVQLAIHFKIDPAKLSIGLVEIPEQITKTISVGDDIIPEKVGREIIQEADRKIIVAAIEKQVIEAVKTAQPVADNNQSVATKTDDEVSLF